MKIRECISLILSGRLHTGTMDRNGRVVELRISSDAAYLRLLRSTIDQVCSLAGFSKMDSSKIVLAVDEACSNVIRHAYGNKSGLPIIITCHILPTKLEITMVDQGEAADVPSIKPRQLNDIRPGGLGVHIIRTVMDEVHYENLAVAGNRLVMAKYLPKEIKP